MHACRHMHVPIGGTMLSKAAAYDSATWNTFQKLNIQVCLSIHFCVCCVCVVVCAACVCCVCFVCVFVRARVCACVC